MPDNAELIDDLRTRLARIRDRQAEHDAALATLTAAQAELTALAATATSADGTVTVTAGAGGIVGSIHLTDDALRATAEELSATITDTVRHAIAEATQRQLAIVHEHTGVDATRILGPQAEFAKLADQPAEPEQPLPAPDDDQPPPILAVR